MQLIHAIQADNAVRTRALHTGGNLLPPEVVLPPMDVVGRVAVLQVDSHGARSKFWGVVRVGGQGWG